MSGLSLVNANDLDRCRVITAALLLDLGSSNRSSGGLIRDSGHSRSGGLIIGSGRSSSSFASNYRQYVSASIKQNRGVDANVPSLGSVDL